ncbi:hypothetical protein BpHYR1_039794 [Brachionus plicatilis]|uniref:Uncharacterized protein n=1 Tax=Brachionus plicatilis TaxID=10195 RepID=A0A3M7QQE7_BRAPC|nr:hypothetical protein BpHYR1_039794 [Brachionus plicatilis]
MTRPMRIKNFKWANSLPLNLKLYKSLIRSLFDYCFTSIKHIHKVLSLEPIEERATNLFVKFLTNKSKIKTIAKEIQEYKLSKDINAQRFITRFDHLVIPNFIRSLLFPSLFLQNLYYWIVWFYIFLVQYFQKKSLKSLILSIASFELKSDFFGFVISSTSESLSSLFSAFEIELIISISDKEPVDIVDVFTPYSLESVVSQARYTFFFLSKQSKN